ncbi:7TM chemoreceptor [Ancylostoma ceylanicum]|uniref:7TM chemoreceptor n=1 Tax=Ancylostoma ceylanicum TaxID=53326 RepID=A0A0D6LZR6_9BILA|nr:7TM chemoreceptor [Ancylostoma ceylanicum]
MATDLEMIGSFTLCAQSISVVALAINVFLIVIYFKCPLKRVREYRYFFLMTAIQDTLLALCCLFLTPITISRESTVVFMATGILHKKPIGEVAIIFFCTVFIVSILIVANSFIYRYIHLCRNEIAHIYQSEKWLALMIAINIIIIINWLCMVLCGNGREATVQYDINPTAVRLSGLNADMNKLTLILLCENWSVMFVLLAVGCFCALQIAHTLRKSSISKNARKYHGQMFTLLLLQGTSENDVKRNNAGHRRWTKPIDCDHDLPIMTTFGSSGDVTLAPLLEATQAETACPAILMQAPVGLMYVMLFTGTSSTTTMTIDYRNYILARVGLRRFERSVSPSARHTFVGTHGTHA